ncbi:tax-2 [Pristionchus pacificus]|nr:tax-2 [Pristionchus pacificus]
MSKLPDRLQQRKFQFIDKFKQSQSRRLYSSDDDASSQGTARSMLSPDDLSAHTPRNMAGEPKRMSLIEEIQFNDPVARDYDAEARETQRSLKQIDPQLEESEEHPDGSRRQTLIPIVIETMPDDEEEDDDDSLSGGLTHRLVKSEAAAADDARSRLSFLVQDRLHLLVSEVKRRTSDVRETLLQEAEEEEISSVTAKPLERQSSLNSLIGIDHELEDLDEKGEGRKPPIIFKRTVNPNSRLHMAWLSLQTFAFLYNAIVIPLRSSYPYQTKQNLIYWLFLDYFFDLVYLADMLIWKPRKQFMKGGMPINSIRETSFKYLKSCEFKVDVVSILPTDLFYIWLGPYPIFRINRLLHFKAFGQLFDMLDNSFSNPYAIRVARTLSYMIYIIHVNSCVYYVLSALQAFGQIAYKHNGKYYLNKWVYNNQGNSYVRCFYFTAAVATSTGNNPAPTNVIEYIYMTFSWMMGVFVFALLLGQIRDIVSNANRNQEEYRRKMDAALYECQRLKLPPAVTARVRSWFIYTWEQHKTLDEKRLIEKLPLKLQTDLALSVHYSTLSKVQLFQDCERALLRDLVLKLRAVIFLPGDMVCSKGDVGKEMYIVNAGVLQVVGGENNQTVFAELGQGKVFGEISLLAIGGNNRRTASIRAKGYATLFALSKQDLQDVIKYYPQAQAILKKKAAEMLKKDKKAEDSKVATTKNMETMCQITVAPEPKMLKVVAQILPEQSETTQILKKALKDRRPSMLLRPDGETPDFSDLSDISDVEEEGEESAKRD